MPITPDHDAARREHGYHALTVKEVVTETHDSSSFVLDVPDELRETFRYRPGQFCTFRVHIDGEEQLRSYSMSSSPETDADLTVTVKRVAGGLVSNWLLDNVMAGDAVEATKPAGMFCPRPERAERPVVGFCGGSGITPVMSITKHVLASTERPVRLLYANRDHSSVIFDRELAALRSRHGDRLEVRHHLDSASGYLRPEDVAAFVGGDLDADFYVCGPGPYMDVVESGLTRLGVASERIFIERFLVEQQEKDAAAVAAGDAGAVVASDAGAASDVPDEVTITLAGKTTVIPYQRGDTVLETARRGGLRPPFSCEAGNCATCMAFLKEGSVRMRANNALTPDEVEEGWILTCQSLPTAMSLSVEYEAM
jgi:3-ketosteroid 9alpha-monooxygenase subunit B